MQTSYGETDAQYNCMQFAGCSVAGAAGEQLNDHHASDDQGHTEHCRQVQIPAIALLQRC
ncbi:MAG: hypothetical protein BFD77_13265 [Pseudomonas sp. CO183]|nr:MAG: hypothetical protein BFD77_13265 [Pseudomonas sp. CO183]